MIEKRGRKILFDHLYTTTNIIKCKFNCTGSTMFDQLKVNKYK